MKERKLWMGFLVLAFVFGTMLTSCQVEDSEPTYYTVYTRSGNASDVPDLQDNYYRTRLLTEEQFNNQASSAFYQNARKNNWTESEIYACLIGMNFSESIANTLKREIVNNKHIEIGFRRGDFIQWLLK